MSGPRKVIAFAAALVLFIGVGAVEATPKWTATHNRKPMPCIRKYEGHYTERQGTRRYAYQMGPKEWDSVSNARQEALWPYLWQERYWPLQDEKAWRLYELKGIRKWSDFNANVRRHCR